jgi:predicted ATPase/signal transduction histidine kinase
MFTLHETLHRSDRVMLYRGVWGKDRRPVLLKVLTASQPRPEDSKALQQEYDLGQELDTPAAVKPLAMATYDGMRALVFEDFGGVPLDRLLGAPMEVGGFLRIAIGLAAAIADIHQQNIVHKGIKPENVLVHLGTGEVKIAGFGIATRLLRVQQAVHNAELTEESLPYMSPEQTGRMNRTLDYRTDFYSLGVIFYEMLVGARPFQANEPIEWMHCHIACVPVPPAERVRGLPSVLSDIVMKLMAKVAEDRYQSGRGLEADLEECRRRLTPDDRIEPFPLGQWDVSGRFQIPQKLYGRQKELAALESACERARAGTPELLLVSGSVGIGKSSVVHELRRSLSQSPGYFVSGKFEKGRRDIPYSALLDALSALVQSVLAEPDDRLAVVRQRLKWAVQDQGSVLTGLLPGFTPILGPLPPASKLSGREAQSRLRYLFEHFVQAFTRHGQPLVIFLDDLQWVDAATLDVFSSLLGHGEAGALLVIGAYRDNEVAAGHPLLASLAEIEKEEGCTVTRMALGPIGVEHVCDLLRDTLVPAADPLRSLADFLWRRTQGNPLFVGELLTALHKSGLVEFDPGRLRWKYDLARIERARAPESMAELMVERTATLSASAQEIVQLASILGSRFEVETLSTVAQRSVGEAAAVLEEAMQEGLIVPIAHGTHTSYQFVHDRVQEAVYAAIPEEARTLVHHRTGKLLLQNRYEGEADNWLFEVLRHLNLSAEQVTDPEQRVRFARLNLKAAERAVASGAFAAAANHYAAGIRFLPEGAWASDHALMFTLHLGLAESEFLRGDHGAAERLFERLRREARTDVEEVQLYELVSIYERQNGKYREAVGTALKALALLGIKMDPEPKAPLILLDMLKTKRAIGGRSPGELLRRSEATEPRVLLAYRLLALATTTAFFTNPILFTRLGLKLTRMVVMHGNTSLATLGYSLYSGVLATLGAYEQADAFGRLALELTERYPSKRVETHARGGYGGGVQFWRNPIRESYRYLEEACQCGLLSGELMQAGYALHATMRNLTCAGAELDFLRQTSERNHQLFRRINDDTAKQATQLYGQAALALQGLTRSLGSFDTDDFDEARYATEIAGLGTKFPLYYYWISKLRVLYILERREEALSISNGARKSAAQVLGCIIDIVDYRFYDALLLASFADQKGVLARRRDLLLIRGHLRKFEKWAHHAPMNFRHKYLLVSAELSRVREDDHAAIGQYEEAIKLARENEFLQDEAIALELAGKFYRSRGLPDVAVSYFARARQAYVRWGAHAKVALLDRAYPGLAARAEPAERAPCQPSPTPLTFDVPSIVKASQALSSEITLDKLLLRLMNIVAENAGAERGALVLNRQGALVVAAEFNVREGARLSEPPLPITESEALSQAIVTYVLRTRESVILSDAYREGAFMTCAYVTRVKPKAVLCAPLVQTGEVKGVLYLENNLVAGAFTAERLSVLEVLATQAAISLENALLVLREQEARALAEAAEQRAGFLAEASVLLSESLEMKQILARLVRLCAGAFTGWCVIYAVEDGSIRRVADAHADPAKEPLLEELHQRFPPRDDSSHPVVTAMRTGVPHLFADVTDAELREACDSDEHARLIRAIGTRTALLVPLVVRGCTLGALAVGSDAPGRRYDKADLCLAEELARRAAIAIDNARLYEQSVEAVRLREEFLVVASHELKTPLTPLRLQLQHLQRTLGRQQRELSHTVDLPLRQVDRLTALVSDLLDVARITGGRITLERAPVDLAEVTRRVAADYGDALQQYGCTLDLSADAPVVGHWDLGRIEQVVVVLLSNAMKYGAKRPIYAQVAAEGARAIVSVRDFGIGIPLADQARIFGRFERAVSVHHYGGLGLGLYIARQLVMAHQGSIRVESEPGRGATFIVELPLAPSVEE